MGMLNSIVAWNVKLSRAIDSLLPPRLRCDGNSAFLNDFVPYAVRSKDLVYDIGGGSRPFISLEEKNRLNAKVIGLDISREELVAAPPGIYDEIIVHDLCTFQGDGGADVAICQALLEHVPDTAGAFRALASAVKPGGRVFIFAPARNALFARLNMALPERLKKSLLFAIFPSKATGHDGFKAYYDLCIPSKIEELADLNGLDIEHRRIFWLSSYFMAFVPAYIFWRIYQGVGALLLGDDAAESFVYVFRKRGAP